MIEALVLVIWLALGSLSFMAVEIIMSNKYGKIPASYLFLPCAIFTAFGLVSAVTALFYWSFEYKLKEK